jgi:hypothetical protein
MPIRAFIAIVISVWLLLSGQVAASTINLSWNASARAVGYEVHYGLAPGNYTESVDTGSITRASISGLIDGQTYYFAALAYNSGGDSPYSNEVSAVAMIPQEPDTTLPVVSITTPHAGDTVPRKQAVILVAEAMDNRGVQSVQFLVNSQVICPGDPTPPYACVWDVPAPPRRVYDLRAIATDTSGNVGQSAIVRVTSE